MLNSVGACIVEMASFVLFDPVLHHDRPVPCGQMTINGMVS